MPRVVWMSVALLCGIVSLCWIIRDAGIDGKSGFARGRNLRGEFVSPFADPVTVLIFVARDCPISNRYLPTVRALEQAYKPRGVHFCLIYPDADATAEQVAAHLREFQLPTPALLDSEGELVATAAVTTVPEAAVFVRDRGRLVESYHGRIDDRYVDWGVARPEPTTHDLRDVLQAVLKDRSARFVTQPPVGCPIARSP